MEKANMKVDSKCISQVLKLFYDSFIADISDIQKHCLEFIDKHTIKVLESESVLGLHKDLMIKILMRDTLYDGMDEVQLYLACLRWARGYGKLDPKDDK